MLDTKMDLKFFQIKLIKNNIITINKLQVFPWHFMGRGEGGGGEGGVGGGGCICFHNFHQRPTVS